MRAGECMVKKCVLLSARAGVLHPNAQQRSARLFSLLQKKNREKERKNTFGLLAINLADCSLFSLFELWNSSVRGDKMALSKVLTRLVLPSVKPASLRGNFNLIGNHRSPATARFLQTSAFRRQQEEQVTCTIDKVSCHHEKGFLTSGLGTRQLKLSFCCRCHDIRGSDPHGNSELARRDPRRLSSRVVERQLPVSEVF